MGFGIRPILVGLPHLGGLARFRRSLFLAMELVDDFVNERFYDRSITGGPGVAHADLSVAIGVDGDRRGGNLLIDNEAGFTNPMEQAQMYTAFPGTYYKDNNVSLRQVSNHTDWVHRPPYADGGGAMIDSEPSFGVVEVYVTPFDSPDLGRPGPEYRLQSFPRENDRVQYPDSGCRQRQRIRKQSRLVRNRGWLGAGRVQRF